MVLISNSFQLKALWSGHEHMIKMAMFNAQRVITPKVGKPKLWFMYPAHRLMVLYICVKYLKWYQSYEADTKL